MAVSGGYLVLAVLIFLFYAIIGGSFATVCIWVADEGIRTLRKTVLVWMSSVFVTFILLLVLQGMGASVI